MWLEKMISDFESVMNVAESNGKFVFIDYDYLKDVVDFIKAQMPQVMTYNEVKAAGSFNNDEYDNDKEIFIWLEEKKGVIYFALPRYNDHPEWGDDEYQDSVSMAFIGSDLDERFWPKDYGKTWRCWTKCPTKEQREAVKWDDT